MTPDIASRLLEKIDQRSAHVGIIGMGYVGLPLAITMAKAGYCVTGVDTNSATVAQLNTGKSHVGDVCDSDVSELIRTGRLQFTDTYHALKQSDCISIAVPTPLTKTKAPNIRCITDAVNALLPHVRQGQLIILESTTYPGTTEELVGDTIGRHSGLQVGKDLFVALSPERVDPGNQQWHTQNTPKVVGGITPTCTKMASRFYGQVMDTVVPVHTTREAETVKLLENTFRAVNIGLVNEFMLMCDRMDIDIWNVINAAKTKPFGFMPFYPGPGIGGHCIPLDPMHLSWKAKTVDFYSRFIELATDINGNMPRYVVQQTADLLNREKKSINGANILILGIAYKKNVTDLRESPGMEVLELLRAKGAAIQMSDPHILHCTTKDGTILPAVSLAPDNLEQFDCVLLITDHDQFDYKIIGHCCRAILDCRDAFGSRGIAGDHITRL